jgi:hypothetical protein
MQIFIDIDAEVEKWDEKRSKELWEVIEEKMQEMSILNITVRLGDDT